MNLPGVVRSLHKVVQALVSKHLCNAQSVSPNAIPHRRMHDMIRFAEKARFVRDRTMKGGLNICSHRRGLGRAKRARGSRVVSYMTKASSSADLARTFNVPVALVIDRQLAQTFDALAVRL